MRNPNENRDIYALVGEIIMEWATVENIVDQTATMIEWKLGKAQDDFTNMSALRSFKERKGHVRKLVETHYKGALPALDRAFRKVTLADPLRHALSHERISILREGDTVQIQAVRPAYRKNDNGQMRLFTGDDIKSTRDNLKDAHSILKVEVQRPFIFDSSQAL